MRERWARASWEQAKIELGMGLPVPLALGQLGLALLESVLRILALRVLILLALGILRVLILWARALPRRVGWSRQAQLHQQVEGARLVRGWVQ